MVGVFVDTSAWYALADAKDPRHKDACRVLQRLESKLEPLLTSDWVFVETMALAAARNGKGAALRLGRTLQDPKVVALHALDEQLRREAWDRFETSSAAVSIVDCGSFALMRRLGVSRAFAFDRDFAEAGFSLEL